MAECPTLQATGKQRRTTMDGFDLFSSTMAQVCAIAAEGVEYHVQDSGADPIATKVKGGIAEQNIENYVRGKGRIPDTVLGGHVVLGGWDVDMGIYHPTYDHKLGLVEFKPEPHGAVYDRFSKECDRTKLLAVLQQFPEWQFGAVCFLHGDRPGPKAHLPTLKDDATKAGDRWHCVEVNLPGNVRTRYPGSH